MPLLLKVIVLTWVRVWILRLALMLLKPSVLHCLMAIPVSSACLGLTAAPAPAKSELKSTSRSSKARALLLQLCHGEDHGLGTCLSVLDHAFEQLLLHVEVLEVERALVAAFEHALLAGRADETEGLVSLGRLRIQAVCATSRWAQPAARIGLALPREITAPCTRRELPAIRRS